MNNVKGMRPYCAVSWKLSKLSSPTNTLITSRCFHLDILQTTMRFFSAFENIYTFEMPHKGMHRTKEKMKFPSTVKNTHLIYLLYTHYPLKHPKA
ncbi:Hypothetical predicted protein [Podarcis lilfordi]|uniref:Uncharacterized protein n=1 Tax=Podarcis lilfordi TaxID=74358 RepID=A0AA35P970_9SAUR|nr:Hypothetical predicted protein [Podarcis lilfordi]